jgi:phage tail-like protein
MSGTLRNNPVVGFNFAVSLTESAGIGSFVSLTVGLPPQGGFSEVSGLDLTIQAEEFREGGNNGTVLKFPGRAVWGNLKLRRGVVRSADLWDWHRGFTEGRGKRRDGVVTLLDEAGEAVRSWRFTRGLPVRWVGPSLNAREAQVAVEEIEIAHEGIRQTGSDGSLLGAIGNLF